MLETEELEELIKPIIDERVDYDINEIDVDVIKEVAEIIYSNTAMLLFDGIVKRNPLVQVLEEMDMLKLEEPKFYSDYFKYMDNLKGVIKNVQTLVKKIDAADKGFRQETYDAIIELGNLIDIVYPIFNTTSNVADMTEQEFSKERYLQLINKFNKSTIKTLDALEKRPSKLDNVFGSAKVAIKIARKTFIEATANMDIKNYKEEKRTNEAAAVEIKLAPSEQERREAIKKANDMYMELELDFVRDLRNQAGLSTWDKYLNFMDVKYKKFKENFNMPLSDNATTKQAKAAMYEMGKLIDAISEISSETYSVGMYQE